MERLFALLTSLCSGKQDKEVAGKASNMPVVQQQHHYIPEDNEEVEDKANQEVVAEKARDKTAVGQEQEVEDKDNKEVVAEKARDKTAVGQQHYIPEDVINVILSKLPVKAILRFKCVCKLWYSLISDPRFDFSTKGRERTIIRCAKYRENWERIVFSNGERVAFYSMEDDQLLRYLPGPTRPIHANLKFFGSCDGLLLFGPCSNFTIYNVTLGNPTTGCWRELPQFNRLAKGRYLYGSRDYISRILATGLCFDESSCDYKAVSIDSSSRVLVASLRKGIIWDDISFPYRVGWEGLTCGRFGGTGFLESSTAGVLAQGHLHWIAKEKTGGSGSDLIVYFDEKLNKFDKLSMPDDEHVNDSERAIYTINSLQVVEGCLCMVRTTTRSYRKTSTISYQTQNRDVLIMKEYGVKESWTRLDGLRGSLLRLYFYNLNYSKPSNDEVFSASRSRVYEPLEKAKKPLFLTTIVPPPGIGLTHEPFTFVETLASVP